MLDTLTVHKYIPEGYSEPTTVHEALIVGRAILAEEGRWSKGQLFRNPHPEVDESTPFCNSWSVCALGAVGAGLLGVGQKVSECTCEVCQSGWDVDLREADEDYGSLRPERETYDRAAEALNNAAHELFGVPYIVSLNDNDDTTLEQVLSAFDKAIQNTA